MGFFPNKMESCNRPENEIHINMGTNSPKSRYIVKPYLGEAVLGSKILSFKKYRFGKRDKYRIVKTTSFRLNSRAFRLEA